MVSTKLHFILPIFTLFLIIFILFYVYLDDFSLTIIVLLWSVALYCRCLPLIPARTFFALNVYDAKFNKIRKMYSTLFGVAIYR